MNRKLVQTTLSIGLCVATVFCTTGCRLGQFNPFSRNRASVKQAPGTCGCDACRVERSQGQQFARGTGFTPQANPYNLPSCQCDAETTCSTCSTLGVQSHALPESLPTVDSQLPADEFSSQVELVTEPAQIFESQTFPQYSTEPAAAADSYYPNRPIQGTLSPIIQDVPTPPMIQKKLPTKGRSSGTISDPSVPALNPSKSSARKTAQATKPVWEDHSTNRYPEKLVTLADSDNSFRVNVETQLQQNFREGVNSLPDESSRWTVPKPVELESLNEKYLGTAPKVEEFAQKPTAPQQPKTPSEPAPLASNNHAKLPLWMQSRPAEPFNLNVSDTVDAVMDSLQPKVDAPKPIPIPEPQAMPTQDTIQPIEKKVETKVVKEIYGALLFDKRVEHKPAKRPVRVARRPVTKQLPVGRQPTIVGTVEIEPQMPVQLPTPVQLQTPERDVEMAETIVLKAYANDAQKETYRNPLPTHQINMSSSSKAQIKAVADAEFILNPLPALPSNLDDGYEFRPTPMLRTKVDSEGESTEREIEIRDLPAVNAEEELAPLRFNGIDSDWEDPAGRISNRPQDLR